MKKRFDYIIAELRTIAMFATCVSQFATFLTVGWWWYQPYGTGAAVMFGSFAAAFMLGIIASLHDDYRVLVFIERRHNR